MDEKVQAILDRLDPSSLREDAGRFAPKLNFDERCGILAAYLSGVSRRLLAAAFNINRRTVTHIYNKNSVHYKEVRKELERMGVDEFKRQYMTEIIANKLMEAEQNTRVRILVELDDKEESAWANKLMRPNPKRTKDMGYHTLHPEHCTYSHRVQIGWAAGHFGVGWYYRDLDGSFPDAWMHSGEESILTSTSALAGAKFEIQDKM